MTGNIKEEGIRVVEAQSTTIKFRVFPEGSLNQLSLQDFYFSIGLHYLRKSPIFPSFPLG